MSSPSSTNEYDRFDCIDFDDPKTNYGYYVSLTVFVVLFCEILVVVSLYFLWEFWNLRTEKQFIFHRHPRLAAAIVLFTVPLIGIIVPLAADLWSIECLSDVSVLVLKNDNRTDISKEIVIVFFVFFFFAWIFTIVLRVWLSRYDYEHKLATKYSFWQIDLDAKDKIDTNNDNPHYQGQWWIDNKNIYGEEGPMARRLFFAAFIPLVAIAVTISPVNEPLMKGDWNVFLGFVGFCATFICLCLMYNVYKVRTIHDAFHIKLEIMKFTKTALVIAGILLAAFGVGRLLQITIWPTAYHWATLYSSLIFVCILFSVTYVSTKWVINEQTKKLEKQKEYLLNNLTSEIEGNTNLKSVLSNRDGFDIFMDFLVTEYSTENLLCYVECTQFLRRWKHFINKMKKKDQVNAAGDSIASMAIVASTQLQGDDKLKKPQLTSETSQSQLDRLDTALENVKSKAKEKVKAVFNEDSDSSDSEDDYNLQDKEHNVIVDEKHAMLNKFKFLKKTKILKDNKLTFHEHFMYIHEKYVSKSSNRQINIRAALYKRYSKVTKDDCDIDNLDFRSVSLLQLLSNGIDDKILNTNRNGSLYSQTAPSKIFDPKDNSPDPGVSPGPADPSPNDISPGHEPNQISVATESNTRIGSPDHDQDQDTYINNMPDGLSIQVRSGSEENENNDNDNNDNNDNDDGMSENLSVDTSHAERELGGNGPKGGAVITLELRKQQSAGDERHAVYKNAPTTPSRSRRTSKNLIGVPMVLKLVDDTRKELWKLMQDSFLRFRSTENYVEYLQNLERKRSVSHHKN